MKRIYSFFILLAFALSSAMTSCENPRGDEIFAVTDDMPVANYLSEFPDEYSHWVDLLHHSGMFSTMNVSALYTCFVPDNQAMQAYLDKNGYQAVTDIDKAYAQTLVKYHTIAGKSQTYTTSSFTNGILPDTTATGDYLSVDIKAETNEQIGFYVNNSVKITKHDTEVTNGVIHTLENVITPITESIWSTLQTMEGYSILTQAIQSTGYDKVLDKIAETIEVGPSDFITQRYYYTIFAVSDAVFAQKGISSFNALVSYLGAGNDYSSEDNALNKYVGYRILGQSMGYDQLANFDGLSSDEEKSKNIANYARTEMINVSFVSPNLYLNYDKASQTGIVITESNISAKNGLIHVVNNIMPVVTPEPANVIWELTDYADIAAQGTSYRVTTLSSAATTTFEQKKITSYTWKSNPEDRTGAVRYYVAQQNDAPRNLALYKDYLMLNLGTYGWIEMESPVMIRGTYKVSAYHYNPLGSPSGILSFIVDGDYIATEVTFNGDSSTTAAYKAKSLGTVTFTENTSHTLRIFAGDSSTTYIDYLLFEPVEE